MNRTEQIIRTVDQLDGLPLDMAAEIRKALDSGREFAVAYRCEWEYNQEATHYIYFPNAGRGGVCQGGNTDWTDCTSLDDLADRWEAYEDCWCN